MVLPYGTKCATYDVLRNRNTTMKYYTDAFLGAVCLERKISVFKSLFFSTRLEILPL